MLTILQICSICFQHKFSSMFNTCLRQKIQAVIEAYAFIFVVQFSQVLMQQFVTMVLLLSPGKQNKIDSYIYCSSLKLKPVIEYHHLAQLFQKYLLLIQSNKKCVIVSILLQQEHALSDFILMFLAIHYRVVINAVFYIEMILLNLITLQLLFLVPSSAKCLAQVWTLAFSLRSDIIDKHCHCLNTHHQRCSLGGFQRISPTTALFGAHQPNPRKYRPALCCMVFMCKYSFTPQNAAPQSIIGWTMASYS